MGIVNIFDYEENITVDDLVGRLRDVRRERKLNKMFEECYKEICGERLASRQRKCMNTSNINSVFNYFNHHMRLGIMSLGPDHCNENAKADILWDFAHLPRSMVYDRLEKEGALISRNSV
jgi:hypothetical protein